MHAQLIITFKKTLNIKHLRECLVLNIQISSFQVSKRLITGVNVI